MSTNSSQPQAERRKGRGKLGRAAAETERTAGHHRTEPVHLTTSTYCYSSVTTPAKQSQEHRNTLTQAQPTPESLKVPTSAVHHLPEPAETSQTGKGEHPGRAGKQGGQREAEREGKQRETKPPHPESSYASNLPPHLLHGF